MKKNGYIFLETIIVISVLSLTLVLLFSSFSFILRKTKERNTYDNIDLIYKSYYIKQIIDTYKANYNDTSLDTSIKVYIDDHASECVKMGTFDSYVCDLTDPSYSGYLYKIKTSFEVEKIYLVNPNKILMSSNKKEWLSLFDATTIDYIKELGITHDNDTIIIKYKKNYGNDNYEIFHSSIGA